MVVAGISAPVAAQQWTADDLYADRPFGNIEVGRAGKSKRTFKRFSTTSLTNSVPIRSRCAVIASDGRFAQWVPQHLCEGRSRSKQRLSHPVFSQGNLLIASWHSKEFTIPAVMVPCPASVPSVPAFDRNRRKLLSPFGSCM